MALFGSKENQYIELPKDNDNSKLFYKTLTNHKNDY